MSDNVSKMGTLKVKENKAVTRTKPEAPAVGKSTEFKKPPVGKSIESGIKAGKVNIKSDVKSPSKK